jgi:hypothetical protein
MADDDHPDHGAARNPSANATEGFQDQDTPSAPKRRRNGPP